ncbi:hypothetical protein [Pseudonocardia sp. TRM90224]|uniref:hypothetical protein n=1 Tax=Pseudonocardia sp. TRM90224 TaxID=2812678 RepID=UPI001E62498C|nr:hypothetical protein [Pseudonocardia sp. TRM90224]
MARKRQRDEPYPRAGARRKPARRRRPPSVASTLGTAVGTALAALLAVLLGGLPWWGWLLIIVVGLGVGALWSSRRTTALLHPPEKPAADPPVAA